MILRYLTILLILLPIKVFAVIEVDITRGNLNPLPIAVSPLSIDEESRKSFKKVLNKENIGSEISIVVENNLNNLVCLTLLIKMLFFKILTLQI